MDAAMQDLGLFLFIYFFIAMNAKRDLCDDLKWHYMMRCFISFVHSLIVLGKIYGYIMCFNLPNFVQLQAKVQFSKTCAIYLHASLRLPMLLF